MKARWDTAPQATGHTGKSIRIRMLTGKHIGFETNIPDIPHVVIRYAERPQFITIVLPGLTGDALILADKPQEN